jgi:glycosyltransferase involved in cell wall biosynthesis
MVCTKPTISVVIPAYNAAKYIVSAIESVLCQDFSDFDIIVVNDGSTDNTLAVLNTISDPRLRVILQQNGGVSTARNFGLAHSNAEYIYFLDADDVLAPDAFTRCWQQLIKAPTAVAVYGESLTFTNDQQIEALLQQTPQVLANRPQDLVVADLLKQNFICTGAIMLRRAAIYQLNGFSTELKLGEDWVFWIALATLGEFVYLPMPVLCLYRQHPQSAARILANDSNNMDLAIKQAFDLPAVRELYSTDYLDQLKKHTMANSLCYSAQEKLKQQQWEGARSLYLRAILIRPFHLRTLILFTCTLIRFIPQFIQKKLK